MAGMVAKRSTADVSGTRSLPVSLAPLSFEDALKALVATPPMGEKPKGKSARRKKSSRRKAS
jgi:hypothetical protein